MRDIRGTPGTILARTIHEASDNALPSINAAKVLRFKVSQPESEIRGE